MHLTANAQAHASTAYFHYLWLAGSTFHPLGGDAQFTYSGNGCMHSTGGTERRFAHKVVLPRAATVKYVRLYAYDNAPSSNITTFFTTYDGAGNFLERETFASTTTGGYGSTLSAEMNYLVDHYAEAVNVVVNLGNATDDSLRFCGVRIAYVPDKIFADGLE